MTFDRRRLLITALAASGVGIAGVMLGTREEEIPKFPSPPPATGASTRSPSPLIRSLTRLGARLASVNWPIGWSVSGHALCVPLARRDLPRSVAVIDTGRWSTRFELPGSLPQWSPDGSQLALIRSGLGADGTADKGEILVASADDGTIGRRIALAAAAVGWSDRDLLALVEGNLVRLRTSGNERLAPATRVVFGPRGDYAVLEDDKTARYGVVRLADGAWAADFSASAGTVLWSSRVAALLAVGDTVRFWSDGGDVRSLTLPAQHLPIALAPFGTICLLRSVAPGSADAYKQFEILSSQLFDIPHLGGLDARVANWSPDARYLAAIPDTYGAALLDFYEVELTRSS